jgi:hypothetical protein
MALFVGHWANAPLLGKAEMLFLRVSLFFDCGSLHLLVLAATSEGNRDPLQASLPNPWNGVQKVRLMLKVHRVTELCKN